MNAKQLKYSQKKVFKAIQNTKLRMFLVLMLIVAVPATIEAITNFDNAKDAVAVVGGVSMASMLAIGNIESVSDNEVAGEALSYRVWLIHENQVERDVIWFNPNENREVGNIPMKPGERAHFFMAHDIPELTSSGERGDLTISATNTFVIIMGGVRQQLLNFVEKFAGGKFFIIFEECGSPDRYIVGRPCRPMVLKNFNVRNNKEARAVTFTFENRTITQYHKYTGTLAGATSATFPLGVSTLTIQPEHSEYIIPNGADDITAIAGMTANDIGRYITLTGKGDDKAATMSNSGSVVLKDGKTWVAKEGAQITLQCYDSGTLIESSRIETA